MAHTSNPSLREADVRRCLWDQGQPGLHNELSGQTGLQGDPPSKNIQTKMQSLIKDVFLVRYQHLVIFVTSKALPKETREKGDGEPRLRQGIRAERLKIPSHLAELQLNHLPAGPRHGLRQGQCPGTTRGIPFTEYLFEEPYNYNTNNCTRCGKEGHRESEQGWHGDHGWLTTFRSRLQANAWPSPSHKQSCRSWPQVRKRFW